MALCPAVSDACRRVRALAASLIFLKRPLPEGLFELVQNPREPLKEDGRRKDDSGDDQGKGYQESKKQEYKKEVTHRLILALY